MDVNSGRRFPLSWQTQQNLAVEVEKGRIQENGDAARRIAASVVLLPLLAGSLVFRMLKGAEPRVSGRIGRAEKAAVRRAFRDRLDALVSAGTAFRLSSVLPFAWRRVHVIGAMEDARTLFPDLDAEAARRLGSERSDVLVIERERGGLVRIDLGAEHSLVAAGSTGLCGPDILVSPIRIAGVRHLQLAATGIPPALAS
jgi:hypothetical protein